MDVNNFHILYDDDKKRDKKGLFLHYMDLVVTPKTWCLERKREKEREKTPKTWCLKRKREREKERKRDRDIYIERDRDIYI